MTEWLLYLFLVCCGAVACWVIGGLLYEGLKDDGMEQNVYAAYYDDGSIVEEKEQKK
jgi:hypothetical protein